MHSPVGCWAGEASPWVRAEIGRWKFTSDMLMNLARRDAESLLAPSGEGPSRTGREPVLPVRQHAVPVAPVAAPATRAQDITFEATDPTAGHGGQP